MSVIEILIDSVDYTDIVHYPTARFESLVNGQPGRGHIRIRDDDRTLSFTGGEPVLLKIDGENKWRGFVVQGRRTYIAPALNVADSGLTRWYDLELVDVNILFRKRIVFNQADPDNVYGTLFPEDTADTTALADLFANFLDLSGDGLDTTTLIEAVASINVDQKARAWSGGYEWGQAMASINMLPNGIFYIDPDLNVVWCDVDTPNAPFGLSDTPNGTTTRGYREMEVLEDGTALANDVLAWGMGYGSQTPVFVRDQDATSISTHGVWQRGEIRSGVYKQATINRIAESIIDGSPSSKRGAKNDRLTVALATYEPGLRVAQKVDFTSNVFGFNDVIPIRKMVITFEAPESLRYDIVLSHEIDPPWGFVDPFFLNLPGFPSFPDFPLFPPLSQPKRICKPGPCDEPQTNWDTLGDWLWHAGLGDGLANREGLIPGWGTNADNEFYFEAAADGGGGLRDTVTIELRQVDVPSAFEYLQGGPFVISGNFNLPANPGASADYTVEWLIQLNFDSPDRALALAAIYGDVAFSFDSQAQLGEGIENVVVRTNGGTYDGPFTLTVEPDVVTATGGWGTLVYVPADEGNDPFDLTTLTSIWLQQGEGAVSISTPTPAAEWTTGPIFMESLGLGVQPWCTTPGPIEPCVDGMVNFPFSEEIVHNGEVVLYTSTNYMAGSLIVILNGLLQREGTDYIETSPDSNRFELLFTPSTTDIIRVIYTVGS